MSRNRILVTLPEDEMQADQEHAKAASMPLRTGFKPRAMKHPHPLPAIHVIVCPSCTPGNSISLISSPGFSILDILWTLKAQPSNDNIGKRLV